MNADTEKLITFDQKVEAALFGLNQLAGGTDAFDIPVMVAACRLFLTEHTGKDPQKEPFDQKEIREAWFGEVKEGAYCTNDLVYPRNNNLVPYAERCTGDHFEPEILGGLTIPGNLVACHQSCNSRKGSLNPVALSKRLNQPLTTILRHTNVLRVQEVSA